MRIMLSGKWYKVPSAILNDADMTRADICVYAYIADALKGKTAAIRTATIADRCELSQRQVTRSVRALERAGYIECQRIEGAATRYTDKLLRADKRKEDTEDKYSFVFNNFPEVKKA